MVAVAKERLASSMLRDEKDHQIGAETQEKNFCQRCYAISLNVLSEAIQTSLRAVLCPHSARF